MSALHQVEKWFFLRGNCANAEFMHTVGIGLERAAKAGFCVLVLSDDRLSRIDDAGPAYQQNLLSIIEAARKLKIRIIPTIAPLGNSNALLWHDINLTESIPVSNLPMIVMNGQLIVKAPPRTIFCCKSEFPNVTQFSFGVSPYRQYRVTLDSTSLEPHSLYISCQSVDGSLLKFDTFRENEWPRFEFAFNPLSCAMINLCVEANSRDSCISSCAVEEIAFYNILRGNGSPLKIEFESGEVLEEGVDFSKICDPFIVNSIRGGRPVGMRHAPPIIRSNNIPSGSTVLASYYHANPIENKLMICPTNPATIAQILRQFEWIDGIFKSSEYLLDLNEVRTFNWCDECKRLELSSSELLNLFVRKLHKRLKTAKAKAVFIIWSDMFDPYHNARSPYYCARGGFENTGLSLPSDFVVASGIMKNEIHQYHFLRNRDIV